MLENMEHKLPAVQKSRSQIAIPFGGLVAGADDSDSTLRFRIAWITPKPDAKLSVLISRG